jgi:hypothetical protein
MNGQLLMGQSSLVYTFLLHILTLKYACVEQFSQGHIPSHKFLQAVLTEAMKCNITKCMRWPGNTITRS